MRLDGIRLTVTLWCGIVALGIGFKTFRIFMSGGYFGPDPVNIWFDSMSLMLLGVLTIVFNLRETINRVHKFIFGVKA